MPRHTEREIVERRAPPSSEQRHRAAVANTLSAARESAARGDHLDALAWLAALEAIGYEFSHEELRLREEWHAAVAAPPCTDGGLERAP